MRYLFLKWKHRDSGTDEIPLELLKKTQDGVEHWITNGTPVKAQCDVRVSTDGTEAFLHCREKNNIYPGTLRIRVGDESVGPQVWWTPQGRSELGAECFEEVRISNLLASDAEPPKRVRTETYRFLRDTQLSAQIKHQHGYKCQIRGCKCKIVLPDGTLYAEAHHLQPLGGKHNGLDVKGNIMCVCPNHHVELDYFCRSLSIEDIQTLPDHTIDQEYLKYHNDQFERGRL